MRRQTGRDVSRCGSHPGDRFGGRFLDFGKECGSGGQGIPRFSWPLGRRTVMSPVCGYRYRMMRGVSPGGGIFWTWARPKVAQVPYKSQRPNRCPPFRDEIA